MHLFQILYHTAVPLGSKCCCDSSKSPQHHWCERKPFSFHQLRCSMVRVWLIPLLRLLASSCRSSCLNMGELSTLPPHHIEKCLWLLGSFLSCVHRGKVKARGTGAYFFSLLLHCHLSPLGSALNDISKLNQRSRNSFCCTEVYLRRISVHNLHATDIVNYQVLKANTKNTRKCSDLNPATNRSSLFPQFVDCQSHSHLSINNWKYAPFLLPALHVLC